MKEGEAQQSSSSSSAVVYLGGFKTDDRKHAWYRVDVEFLQTMTRTDEVQEEEIRASNKRRALSVGGRPQCRWVLVKKRKEKIRRLKLNTFAELKETSSYHGCCTALIDEDIYWYGEFSRRPNGSVFMIDYYMDLLKHNIHNADPFSWETLSSSTDCPSIPRYFFAAPIGNKLYFLSGTDGDDSGDGDEDLGVNSRQLLNRRGTIYDLDSNTWENLKCNYSIYTSPLCYSAPYVALTENKKEILFYSLQNGSVLFLDLTSGQLRNDESHYPLALWYRPDFDKPRGLEGCHDLENLIFATRSGPAVFSNSMLYWFTNDLHLYGYDINLRRWFQSPFLGMQFPTLAPLNSWNRESYIPYSPFMVDMHCGKFLVIVPEDPGELTVAPLTVVRKKNSLSVSVETVHPLSLDDTSFKPKTGMAMLKNTR